MWFIPLFASLRSSTGRRQKSRPIRNCRPVLEYLEDRRLLSAMLTESGVSPNSGPAPGTIVQVSGTGFVSGSKVFFNKTLASFSGNQTSTLLSVAAPALQTGSYDVSVVNPDGQTADIPGAFFAFAGSPTPSAPAPSITSVTPSAGPAAGGSLVTISGSNFQSGVQVSIGNVAATISGTPTATSITVVAPALQAGTVDVKVVNPDGQQAVATNAYTAVTTPTGAAPTITGVSPHFGLAGTMVQIAGTNFQSGSQVLFGTTPATFSGTQTDTLLTVLAPVQQSVSAVDVKVVNPDGQQAVSPGAFITIAATGPVINGVSPNFGMAPGAVVAVVGTGFQAGSQVSFGGVPATISGTPTPTTITVIVPALSFGLTDVKVTNPGGQSFDLSDAFFALSSVTGPAPTITSVSPSSGPAAGGTLVTISGTNFQGGLVVLIGGIQATVSGSPTPTSVTVITPALSVGAKDVTVINPDNQQVVATGAFVATATVAAPPPVVTGVNPNTGPTAGGVLVTISGTGFQTGSQVFIGGFAATISGTPTATALNVITPALPAGPANVEVVNPDGQFNVATGAFVATTVTPPPVTGAPPVVSGVSPNSGPGGTVVQVSGTGFQAGSKVFIGGVLAPLSLSPTATLLTVVAPSLPIGLADVKVVNPDSQQSVLAGAFFALPGGPPPVTAPPPVVTGVSPGSGAAAGGTLVTISGTGFQVGSQVFIGGVAATISGTPTATSLTVISPPLPLGAADVKVVNPDGRQSVLAGAFVATTAAPNPAPVVNSITPNSGAATGGVTVQISGTGFQAGVKVFIGGLAATISGTPTDTAITVVTPSLPLGAADVKVVNPDGQQVLLAGAFLATPPPPPTIMLVNPHFGPAPGTVVTITGNNFVPGGTKVFFNNVLATFSGTQTATTLTVIVPALPSTGPADIKVVNPDGQQVVRLGSFFALAAAPVITGISPNSGPPAGGTVVTISGTGFQTGSQVFIGGKAALAAGAPTATTLTVTTPALAVGPADVRITNPDGQTAVRANGFTVVSGNPLPTPPPVASSINPTSGPAAGGTTVTITGTGFQATSQVFIGGVPATITGTPTATSLTVVTPPLPVGPADVKVVNPDGQQSVLSAAFTAQPPGVNPSPPPVATAINPTSGAPGKVVTISGTGFQATSQVFIGGVAAPLSGTQTATALTVVVPSLPQGTVDVKVVNPDAQQSVLTGAFTVLAAPPPNVSGVSPNSGAPGSTVQVMGSGFQPGSKVFFGNAQATVSGTPTSTLLTVVVPNLPVGSVDVKVVNADGTQSVLSGGFFVT